MTSKLELFEKRQQEAADRRAIMTNYLVKRYTENIVEALESGDTEFIESMIRGDGYRPLSDMTMVEIADLYKFQMEQDK